MALRLNLSHEYIRTDRREISFYSEHFGKNTEQMPQLLSDCRVPMSIAERMRRILAIRNVDDAKVKSAWIDNYFDTADLKAQKGNEIKLVLTTYADRSLTQLGREALSWIDPKEKLINRAVNLGIDERYEKLQGKENGVIITRRDKLTEVVDDPLTQRQALDSLFWRVVLRYRDEVPEQFAIQGLHEEAVRYIFSEYKSRFASNTPILQLKT